MKSLTVKATIENLDDVVAFIDKELENTGCGMKAEMQINIAVEELFVNVAHYAYAPGTGDITITISIHEYPPTAEITLTDSGKPYNPLSKKDPDVNQSAEQRAIGGLGIFMVKKTMDLITYDYVDGQNVVKIFKHF